MSTKKPRVHYGIRGGLSQFGVCGEQAKDATIDIVKVTCRVCRRRYFSLERDRMQAERARRQASEAYRLANRGRA